jgi:alpha-D-xyloside xylohydrolase
MQLSIPPWRYKATPFGTMVRIAAERCFRARASLLPLLDLAVDQAVEFNLPVVRPLWMAYKNFGTSAPSVEDAYMVGDCVVVAPLLMAGVRSRSVVLPPGSWTYHLVNNGSTMRSDGFLEVFVTTRLLTDPAPYFKRTEISYCLLLS